MYSLLLSSVSPDETNPSLLFEKVIDIEYNCQVFSQMRKYLTIMQISTKMKGERGRAEMPALIARDEYLDQLKTWREKEMIKVVTGVRRCGKSTLFELYGDYLKASGVTDEQIISINLEDEDNSALLDHAKLHEYVKDRLRKDKWTYVFIDEVQNCNEYERAVSSLYLRKNVDIYITGSNAYMLSGELATKLAGRYIEIDMLPLSFSEFGRALNIPDRRERFLRYMSMGGFPYALTMVDNAAAHAQYLEGIYNTVLIKDVITRQRINDISVIEAIVKFLSGNIGNSVSAKKIADTMKSNGRPISENTVENYIRALTGSYLFYKVERYDIKGRQHLKTAPKYYACDTGLRNAILGSENTDIGFQLENIVYLELIRRGYRVSIGKTREQEVDFVAVKGKETMYVQVAYLLAAPETVQREFGGLERIKDNYPKYVISMDDVDMSRNGIIHKNIAEFLEERSYTAGIP